jgi:hypothetical protein
MEFATGGLSGRPERVSVRQLEDVPLGRPLDWPMPLRLGMALAPHTWENDDPGALT